MLPEAEWFAYCPLRHQEAACQSGRASSIPVVLSLMEAVGSYGGAVVREKGVLGLCTWEPSKGSSALEVPAYTVAQTRFIYV